MFTGILWTLLILETFIMGASQTTCKITHLQEIYCRNENVFRSRLYHVANQSDTYKMEIQKIYKGDDNRLDEWHQNYINMKLYTYSDKRFLIFGRVENGTFLVDPCFGVLRWRMLTNFQTYAILSLYKKGCNCVPQIPEYSISLHCIWHYAYFLRENGNCVSSRSKSLEECQQKLDAYLYRRP